MAVDMFLKIAGIKGESQKDGHKDEIDVISFQFGAAQTGAYHKGGAGGGAGKAEISDISVVKEVDKTSPLLFKACATGQYLTDVTIYSQKAAGPSSPPLTYYEIKLTDAIVSSHINNGSSHGDAIMETVVFNTAKVDFKYTPQKADLTADASVDAWFSMRENKAG